MDKTLIIIMTALALVALFYAAVNVKRAIRREGLVRFFKALSALAGAMATAGWKLIAGGRATPSSSSRTRPLDLSGTGGHYNARAGNYDNGQDPYGIYPDDDRRL